eukprot:5036833-Pyramimonas_sp.AAC.1
MFIETVGVERRRPLLGTGRIKFFRGKMASGLNGQFSSSELTGSPWSLQVGGESNLPLGRQQRQPATCGSETDAVQQ